MSKFRNVSLLQPDEKVTDEQLATEMKLLANQRAINRLSRRNFLTSASLAVGATGAMAMAGCGTSKVITVTPITPAPNPVQSPSQIDVMNFALNLEYLEASFYLYATTGSGLSTTDQGSGAGTVTGGAQVSFSDPNVAALAQQLAEEEQAHVELLQAAIAFLGGTAVPMPALNLAALGTVTNDASFLAMARQLETVGTSAYEGGITLFNDGAVYLTIAADIHALEAQHEGALRQFCIAKSITSAAVDSLDIAVAGAAGPVFNTTGGLNTVRTPSQVLQIVYGTPGVTGTTSGGFYPNGMNNANSALTTS
jgi:hypothetical protein